MRASTSRSVSSNSFHARTAGIMYSDGIWKNTLVNAFYFRYNVANAINGVSEDGSWPLIWVRCARWRMSRVAIASPRC